MSNSESSPVGGAASAPSDDRAARLEAMCEEWNSKIKAFETELRDSGHRLAFQARIESPDNDGKAFAVFHVVSWRESPAGEWSLYYSREELGGRGPSDLLEHRPVLSTRWQVRARIVEAIPVLREVAKTRGSSIFVPHVKKFVTEDRVEAVDRGQYGAKRGETRKGALAWRFARISELVNDAGHIELTGRGAAPAVFIDFLNRVTKELHLLGARGELDVYLEDEEGRKAAQAGIDDRMATVDALHFYFCADFGDVTADFSPDGIESWVSGSRNENVALEEVPEYLVRRLRGHLKQVVLELLTEFYGQVVASQVTSSATFPAFQLHLAQAPVTASSAWSCQAPRLRCGL